MEGKITVSHCCIQGDPLDPIECSCGAKFSCYKLWCNHVGGEPGPRPDRLIGYVGVEPATPWWASGILEILFCLVVGGGIGFLLAKL